MRGTVVSRWTASQLVVRSILHQGQHSFAFVFNYVQNNMEIKIALQTERGMGVASNTEHDLESIEGNMRLKFHHTTNTLKTSISDSSHFVVL